MFKRPATRVIALAVVLVLGIAIVACAGAEGPAGPEGPPGPPGPEGSSGEGAGAVAEVADPEYVGSEACAACHEETTAEFFQNGHSYKLNPVVDGQPPEYPFSEVPDPPEGYTWDDISYVIGGHSWKARFINHEGFIITDGEDSTTQYNLYNEDLDMGPNWVPYHPGEERPYDCGTCHTTGYSDYPPDSHQDDLPGLIGTWALPGIHCEECHGPASLHVADPGNEAARPEVSRDSELCGQCHIRGDVTEIDASGVFIKHHEQYEESFQSKHRTLECVDCHDPHATTRYRDEPEALGSGVRIECANCHWEQDTFFRANHTVPTCEDCHMAKVAKSALGDADRFTGDVASHLFGINPYASEQFYETDAGLFSQPYVTVDYACMSCHSDAGIASPKTTEELQSAAQGYHDRP